MIDINRAFAPAVRYVAEGRIPGATLGMVAADGRRWVTHIGMAALVPEPEPLTLDHWFDLASVSKVIAPQFVRTASGRRLAGVYEADLQGNATPDYPTKRGALVMDADLEAAQALAVTLFDDTGEGENLNFARHSADYVSGFMDAVQRDE